MTPLCATAASPLPRRLEARFAMPPSVLPLAGREWGMRHGSAAMGPVVAHADATLGEKAGQLGDGAAPS